MEADESPREGFFPGYTWVFLICLGVMNIAWAASQYLHQTGNLGIAYVVDFFHLGLDIDILYPLYILYLLFLGIYRIVIAILYRKIAPVMITVSWIVNLTVILALIFMHSSERLINGTINTLFLFLLDTIPVAIMLENLVETRNNKTFLAKIHEISFKPGLSHSITKK